eukprot:scaffold4278_cov129-Isochrysis_galbana.AAC.4
MSFDVRKRGGPPSSAHTQALRTTHTPRRTENYCTIHTAPSRAPTPLKPIRCVGISSSVGRFIQGTLRNTHTYVSHPRFSPSSFFLYLGAASANARKQPRKGSRVPNPDVQ